MGPLAGMGPAVFIAAVAVVGLLVERLLLGRCWRPYDQLGLPLGEELRPLLLAPRGEGRTASVRYRVIEGQGRASFWAQPGDRSAPMGLHGNVDLIRTTKGIAMEVRWAPPWTLLVILIWFAGLGVARGMGGLTVPIAAILLVVVVLGYRKAAQRAARELRWAFVQQESSE